MKNKEVIYSFLNRFMKNLPIYWYEEEVKGKYYDGYVELPGANPSDKEYSYYFRFYRNNKLATYEHFSGEFYSSIIRYFPIEHKEMVSILIDWFNDNKHHLTIEKEKIDWL